MIELSRGRTRRTFWLGMLTSLVLASSLTGCGPTEVETTYGRSRGKSINGTNAIADLIRSRGHKVRAALRYNETLGEWAKVLVRFAPYPGPPSRVEAQWLTGWLRDGPGRKLVYIPRDFDAGPEFWAQMLAALPSTAPDSERNQIEARRLRSLSWPIDLPDRPKEIARVDDWFGTEPSAPKKLDEVAICRKLAGPWAEGIDPAAAALPRHEVLLAENDERVLLSGDGGKLVVTWTSWDDERENDQGNVLVIANGSFLLNAGLLNKARRPLATRVVDWIGDGADQVAFVEGVNVLTDNDATETSTFHLLTVEPFNWVTAHLGVFGVLFCLSLAATIGRPRPEPTGEIDRPSAHPIALGAILARTRQVEMAQDLIAVYRRWRHPSATSPRTVSTPSSPRRVPRA